MADKNAIFTQLAEAISELSDFRVFHFGGYDKMALKKFAPLLPAAARRGLEAILQCSTNVLSLIHPHV